MNYVFKLVRETLDDSPMTVVTGCNIAARHLYKYCFDYATMHNESCWAIFLDGQNRILGQYEVSQGCDNACVVNKKLVTLVALQSYARSVILAHNHPSGNLRPSASDIRTTQDLKRALAYFDINLLDHIIVTDKAFYSFAEERTEKAPVVAPVAPIAAEDIFTAEDIKMLNNTMQMAFAAPIL